MFTLSDQTPPANMFAPAIRDANCGQHNGSLIIPNNTYNLSYAWLNASNDSIGSGLVLNKINPGTYYLQAWIPYDRSCNKTYGPFVINNLFGATVNTSAAITTACDQTTGSITGITASNVTGTPFLQWTDAQGRPVGNSYDLKNVPAGKYQFTFKDAASCDTVISPWYTVNPPPTPNLPVYDDVIIPINTNAGLTIKNPSTGTYKLYADAGTTIPLQDNSSGNFTVTNVKADTSVYVLHSLDSCINGPVRVKITVVDKSFFTIPNAFTPNGDGKNDRLNILVKGSINLTYFRIYNRWGQLVFESRRVNEGWNGFFKGELQLTGAYVWMAEGKDLLGNVIKEKGSFVLIR
jgi:gliding motility-associated-like protein